ncbi:hypothetical protein FB451DRAFT_1536484 [Mycena latifolia]|nr:hypothetical protein FB451DRAFT_1536484 [Mycena latifolia]
MPTKRAGLSGLKATAAYKVLQNLKTVLVTYPDDDDPEAGKDEDPQKVAEAAAELQEMNDLVSRLEAIFSSASSKSVSFPKVTDKIMKDVLDIKPHIPKEYLSMKPREDLVTLATQRNGMGENSLWSLENYVQQLDFLERTVPRFRFVKARVLEQPQIASLHGLTGLFTAEAKQDDGPLDAHLPQALAEQYACAIQLKKKILRGVLTNGEHWIFLVVTRKDSDTGRATFRRSPKLTINFITAMTGGPRTVYRDTIDLIPAILADFVRNKFANY